MVYVNKVPVDKRVCYACGSRNTALYKGQFPAWHYNRDADGNVLHQLCNACRQSILIRYEKIELDKAYKAKQIYFKTRCVKVGYAPRIGVCNWCRAVYPFDTKLTHMHHEAYDVDSPANHIIELCISCHRLETIRVREMTVMRDSKTGRIIRPIYNK